MFRWLANHRQSVRDRERAEDVERLNNQVIYGYRYAAGCLLRHGDGALSGLSDVSNEKIAQGETGRAFATGIEAAIDDYSKQFKKVDSCQK